MIQLKAIVDALQEQNQEVKAYLNRKTGEVVLVSNEEMSAAEEGEDLEDFPEWQQELIRQAIDVLETDDYVKLPSQFDVHEWSIMQEFCDSVTDERLQQRLLSAIHGKGAFRNFKNVLYERGIEQSWYDFRDDAFRRIAREWLEENDIPFQDDATPAPKAQVTTPSRITAIDHVQLAMPAKEEEKARSFYSGILGLQEVSKPEKLAKRGGVWFELGSVKVHLGVEENFQPAKKAHPAFLVEGWETLIARCQAAGYQITPDDLIPGVRRAYVHDPFGNRIELIDGE